MGSDEAKTIQDIKAIKEHFPCAIHILYSKQVQDNVCRHSVGAKDKTTNRDVKDIFGPDGLLFTANQAAFETWSEEVKDHYLEELPEFFSYFLKWIKKTYSIKVVRK